ncbi:hypothetical protein HPC38_01770 [Pasteurellaceae bacterium HPA106]|uniref:hypothetical protein n=1 Tax=Spirabiliibacterium pneumoniae TaxID=221400 RepID=UPI001AAC9D38|nr:hypothetical protein [Spirabiliibacterium pneumoniae]MBE2895604.1 hypothetical protein [Spirabiliibacterium pneumoniae]
MKDNKEHDITSDFFDLDAPFDDDLDIHHKDRDDKDSEISLDKGEKISKKFDDIDRFSSIASIDNDDLRHTNRRVRTREAKAKMTKKEYRDRLEELNKEADQKHYVLLFGASNSGKSYIIASLMHFMNSYLAGTTRLVRETATENESLMYNQMLEMFANPEKNIGRTSAFDFYELNIRFQPEEIEKPAVDITFIDASGENFERIYHGKTNEYVGELPDYIEVILESEVDCMFVFVYDQSLKDSDRSDRAPQSQVLKAFYDKIISMQERYERVYQKLLLLSKSDKIPEQTKKKYGHSAKAFALSPPKENRALLSFSNPFFNERNSMNKTIFYSMGTFTKYDDLDKFDEDCPRRFFNWIYTGITGSQGEGVVIQKLSCLQRFKKWLLGK